MMRCFTGTDCLPGDSGQCLRPCCLQAKNGDKEISLRNNNWPLSSDFHWVLSTFYYTPQDHSSIPLIQSRHSCSLKSWGRRLTRSSDKQQGTRIPLSTFGVQIVNQLQKSPHLDFVVIKLIRADTFYCCPCTRHCFQCLTSSKSFNHYNTLRWLIALLSSFYS